jgi:ABC-type bacteriocin/lantibiotic exporter with double-glycine peptidase domain
VPKILLPVSHHKQQGDGDCLAACAAMVLEFFDRAIDYQRLLALLKVANYGAPAGNIRNLSQLGLSVTYSVIDLGGLLRLLQNGIPAIIFLRTGDLPYWQYQTDHAVVAVGFDDSAQTIFFNDPYFDEAPIAVPLSDFELAWLERDYHYATVTP